MKKRIFFLFLFGISLFLFGCNESGTTNNNGGSTPTNPVESQPTQTVELEYTYSTYMNPTMVVNSQGNPYKSEIADPSIVRGDDGYLYIFATNGRILRSEDGCSWEKIADQTIGSPDWWSDVYNENPGAGLWAPDVIKIGDSWMYYYSLSAWGKCVGIGYAMSDNVDGPYEDMGKLFTYKEIGVENAIDPHVFIDDDGSVYMSFGSFQGLYLVELTEDGTELKGGLEQQYDDKVLIAGKVGAWDGSTYEGSYIIKKDDYYYYFGSVGTCCEGKNSSYYVVCGRSESIYGPYVDSKGLPLTASGDGKTYGDVVVRASLMSEDTAGVGHNSILLDDAGDYWIYYHGYSKEDNFATRHLFMDKLYWTDEGWPRVGYSYEDEDTLETKTTYFKPSFLIELDGPRFLLK